MEQPNIILIVCDTLRKDVLELYGGRARTPFLNKLKKEAMVYDNCIAPSPWTFPSHVSLFTGLYPSKHGIHERLLEKLPNLITKHEGLKAKRLYEYLSELGYKTVGMSNNMMVSRFTHFDVGFDYFLSNDPSPWYGSKGALEAMDKGINIPQIVKNLIKEGKFDELTGYGHEYLRLRSLAKAMNFPFNKGAEFTNQFVMNSKLEKPLFLFLNLMEAHEPYIGYDRKERLDNYTGVKAIKTGKVMLLKHQYELEAEHLDRKLEDILSTLKSRGLYENSLIIITSDHGQAFNEHGFMYHNIYLYDEIIRIPLIIKYPEGKKFKKIKGYQSLVNIFPFIISYLKGGGDRKLTTRTAFSEASGDSGAGVFPKTYDHRKNYVNEKYEKVRKTVYMDGFKLTVNLTEGKIEEFTKDGMKIDPDDALKNFKVLSDELARFGAQKRP